MGRRLGMYFVFRRWTPRGGRVGRLDAFRCPATKTEDECKDRLPTDLLPVIPGGRSKYAIMTGVSTKAEAIRKFKRIWLE